MKNTDRTAITFKRVSEYTHKSEKKNYLSHITKWIDDLRIARGYLQSNAIDDEKIRRTLRRAVEYATLEAGDEYESIEELENDTRKWSEEDMATLNAGLDELGLATDYAVGVLNLTTLSLRLRRREPSVKKKIIEMGRAECIDWWYAKSRHKDSVAQE